MIGWVGLMRKSSFEDLECWKRARELKLLLKKEVLPRLPADEKYRLDDQLIRASRSVVSDELMLEARALIDECIRLLNGYRAYVLKRRDN